MAKIHVNNQPFPDLTQKDFTQSQIIANNFGTTLKRAYVDVTEEQFSKSITPESFVISNNGLQKYIEGVRAAMSNAKEQDRQDILEKAEKEIGQLTLVRIHKNDNSIQTVFVR